MTVDMVYWISAFRLLEIVLLLKNAAAAATGNAADAATAATGNCSLLLLEIAAVAGIPSCWKRVLTDVDKVDVMTAWRRIDCRTREALRRSFLSEWINGYEFYNLVSSIVTLSQGTKPSKMKEIRKKRSGSSELPNITLCKFLKMAKEGFW